MKRRAGVTTDHNLARFLGVAQSTVSHWRHRQQIPESALLRAERLLSAGGQTVAGRLLAARTIALRLPEFWYLSALASGAKGGRSVFYRSVALAWPKIIDAIYEQVGTYERQTGQSAMDLTPQLLEDDRFIESLVDFAKTIPVTDAVLSGLEPLKGDPEGGAGR
ncbi:MAG: helix-turn-helix domain-containing protein [Caulobacteraceae bacterium]